MLASDLNNPDFQGARNPDDALFVEFYMHRPEDQNKSIEAGKKIYGEPTPYVRIQVPGDKTSLIETPVREDHKARWPQKWLYFQMKEGLVEGNQQIPGWDLDEWEYLSDDEKRELKYNRFTIVEQIAHASDSQIQRVGMRGVAVREAARKALRERANKEFQAEMEAKDKQLAEMRIRLEKLEKTLAAPQAPSAGNHSGEDLSAVAAAPKKRGRPKKIQSVDTTTNV